MSPRSSGAGKRSAEAVEPDDAEAPDPEGADGAGGEADAGDGSDGTGEAGAAGTDADAGDDADGGDTDADSDDDASSDLASVTAARDSYLADLQRVTAEFTNFRRQTVKRNTELVAQAAARLATKLLPVLDACEAAVSQGVEGIDAVQGQLLGVLSGEGLTVLGAVDEPFDPGIHEAVMSEGSGDDDQAAPVVAEVLRSGYAWNGRLLRPAQVKVRG